MELEPFVFRHSGVLTGTRSNVESSDVAEAVNAYALRPLDVDEYAVFSLELCHNGIDRHFSRFPDEELVRINDMAPGRPLMERHDLGGSLPRGRFFRSELRRDGERLTVCPDVYVLRTRSNEEFVLNIEGGVYQETSIGFSFKLPECSICGKDLRTCDHVPGRTYGDECCHYIMRDVQDVIEGSIVPAGSQGTRVIDVESRGRVFGGAGEPLPLANALCIAREAFHRPVSLWSRSIWRNA